MVPLPDFQYKTITIKHTVIETSNGKEYQLFLKDTTKNKKSLRTLPLSDATVDTLLKMKQRQEKMKLLFGNRYNHEFDDYIYVFENGDLVRPNWVTACFKRLLDDNNMPISDSMISVIAVQFFFATREFRWKTSRNGSVIPTFLPRSRSMPIMTT